MKISIPIIHNIDPTLTVKDICSVQPMQSSNETHTLKFKIVTEETPSKEGDTRHVFGRGYEIFYNAEWISYELYLKLKIKGL